MLRVIIMLVCVSVGVYVDHPLWGMFFGIVFGLMTAAVHPDPYPWSKHRPPVHRERALRVSEMSSAKPEVIDEAAVQALMALGANRKGALMALTSIGWAGNTTEERVINALRAEPPN